MDEQQASELRNSWRPPSCDCGRPSRPARRSEVVRHEAARRWRRRDCLWPKESREDFGSLGLEHPLVGGSRPGIRPVVSAVYFQCEHVSIHPRDMSGLEGPAFGIGVKAGSAAAKRFFKTNEFDRLCARLAERFGDRVPYSAADYARWAKNDVFAAALGKYLRPPHEFDRQALVTAITPLVGPLDSDTTAGSFAAMVADAIRDELRLAKEGDALVRLEADRVIGAVKGIAEIRPGNGGGSEVASAPIGARSAPRLSIGEPRIEGWQKITVQDGEGRPVSLGRGRLIRVPVTNAQGVDTARHVHAQLRFLPKDVHRSFAPTHPARGEWFGDHGPETEIHLPGNGGARLLDVVVVLDWDYPHAYEWTSHSRAAALVGYEIKAVPFDVEVVIMGSAATPMLQRTLQVECRRGHMIRADWVDKRIDEPTNWVPW